MRISIDPYSGIPVYLQIAQGIKRLVAMGSLKEGEQLPPVREVAEMLTVNPNTVARAYRHLEQEAVVVARKGVGTYVLDGDLSISERERRRVIVTMMDRMLVEADHLRLDRETLRSLFQERMEALLRPADTEASS